MNDKYMKEMKIKGLINISVLILLLINSILVYGNSGDTHNELPNILWLTSEDNSPFLGCYGDEFATTPNLDKLASEGFLYTHAYANAPVCAPARNTIITGIYATSGGNHNMRSHYSKSEKIKTYPEYLREAGYFCTNNSKTDYNTNSIKPNEIWDESGKEAHYKNRPNEKPFFAIFNSTISHESSIFKWKPNEKLRHSPEEVFIPPYHPKTDEMKHDWAQYYDKVEDMDSWIGKKLQELEDSGLAENTIVFYYGDHGGVLARSKRYVYETGTRVPFIVRIPEKYKHLFPENNIGSEVNRLISFVDLVPTLLSIADITIPEYLQGNAFLGDQKSDDPQYAFMFRGRMDERNDMSRAVRDKKYRYIKNYMPHRIYAQHLEYLWRAPSIVSWEKAWINGECNEVQSIFWNTKPTEELYDTENDPWEVNNLANDPEYNNILARMRKANKDWITEFKDAGFIPEADLVDRVGEKTIYDYMRSGEINLQEIIDAAEISSLGDKKNIDQLVEFLKSDDSAIRYWGATGLLILGDEAATAIDELKVAANDKSASVVNVAAEALYNLGEKEIAEKALLSVLEYPNEIARCYALNVIDRIGVDSPALIDAVKKMDAHSHEKTRKNYDFRAAKWLLKKWNIGTNKSDF